MNHHNETGMKMNYAIGCTDIVSGQKGCFGFGTDEYLSADKPLQFVARTPIFDGLDALFDWAKKNDVNLFMVPVNWGH